MPKPFALSSRSARKARPSMLSNFDRPARLEIGRAAADWAKNGANASDESFKILARARVRRVSASVPKGPGALAWKQAESSWVHTGSAKSPGTGIEIKGEGGPQKQIRIPEARFTAARKERARKLRAERAAKRAARFSLSGKADPPAWRKTEFLNNSTINQRGRMPLFAEADLPRGSLRGQTSIFDFIGKR